MHGGRRERKSDAPSLLIWYACKGKGRKEQICKLTPEKEVQQCTSTLIVHLKSSNHNYAAAYVSCMLLQYEYLLESY